ncbi:MAG: M1 family metallopeptidase [Marinifilaceae bacterium]
MKNVLLVLCLFMCMACRQEQTICIKEGVSRELASYRKRVISEVIYDLTYRIPASKDSLLQCTQSIHFTQHEDGPLILDYKNNDKGICMIRLNGNRTEYRLQNEHLIIDHIPKGAHQMELSYCVSNHSLNRRDDFLYTLLVPDRACTLFPCFDQPDIKASYRLALSIPISWTAIANGVAITDTVVNGYREMEFAPTEPLSTYLFSFVTGIFNREEQERNGQVIRLYHRETDSSRLKQIPIIYNQIFESIAWLEEYTGIKYPFAKYDLIILPGFQYGGMEHTGATLYNDTRMFLANNASLQEELERTKLIAHETAHMWFGDYVTMDWFNEVWMKEVFANYFASKMTEPHFPNLNHNLTYTHAFFPVAYAEDRTTGANPIIQQLPNLKDAGLIYGSIIYNKTPIVMSKLVEKIGEDSFCQGIQIYLQRYAYGNATWNNLVTILDSLTSHDIVTWNKEWMERPGRPKGRISRVDNGLQIYFTTQKERREQALHLLCMDILNNESQTIEIQLPKETRRSGIKNSDIIIPNSDGKAYGYWQMDSLSLHYCLNKWSSIPNETSRLAVLINMFEAVCEGDLPAQQFFNALIQGIPTEQNRLVRISAMNYLQNVSWKLYPLSNAAEEQIWSLMTATQNKEIKQRLFRLYMTVYNNPKGSQRLWQILSASNNNLNLSLEERDIMTLCYELSLRDSAKYSEIKQQGDNRITNVDRKKEFNYIIKAVHPSKVARDSLFALFISGKERDIEPWCQQALSYLNHPSRQQHALAYIRPALNALPDVQRTGDIFFPKGWIQSVLKGHKSIAASDTVKQFLQANPDYPQLMKNKILQSAGHLIQ